MNTYKPKCYCTAMLMDDGTCRFRCPPHARRPGLRALKTGKIVAERERRAKMAIGIPADRASAEVAKFDKRYAAQVADLSRRQVCKRKRSLSGARA